MFLFMHCSLRLVFVLFFFFGVSTNRTKIVVIAKNHAVEISCEYAGDRKTSRPHEQPDATA